MMNALLLPATRIMNRLGVAGKMGLMGIVVMVPVVLLIVMLLGRIQADLAFSQKETMAVPVIHPASRFMKAVQAHRGLATGILSGDKSLMDKYRETEAAAAEAIAQGDKADAAFGAVLATSADWGKLKAEWVEVKASCLQKTVAESIRIHSTLVAHIQDMVGRAADQSNATMDPELDTYYLQDLFAGQLPRGLEHLGIMRATSTGIAAAGKIDLNQRIRLETLHRFVDDDRNYIYRSLGKAVASDATLKAKLEADGTVFEDFSRVGLKMAREGILDSESVTAQAPAVFGTFTKAMDAGWSLAETAQTEFAVRVDARLARLANDRLLALGSVILALAVVLYLFVAFRRSMLSAITAIRSGAERMTHGELDKPLFVAGHDELADIAHSLNAMQKGLLEKIEADRAVAAENLRIRFALECVTMPVTLSDEQHRLIFMNKAAEELWQGMAGPISRRMPGFSVAQMQGKAIGDYLDDEASRELYRRDREQSRTLDMGVAERKLRITVSPVRDVSGAYRGRVSQWLDRTQDVTVEGEVAALVEAAVRGNLQGRLPVAGREGFHLRLAEGLNRLMDVISAGLEDVGRVLDAIAHGVLTERVEGDYEGTFGRLADDTNLTVARLKEVVGRIKDASESISQAAKEIAQGNADLSSRTEEQASSLEETASSMEEINATVKQNADNASQAKHLAANSNEFARHGGEMMSKVSGKMHGIQDSSHRIAEIVGVIDSIAFQTNILALNAAVEAARAGEQGRGFAVVATEVRTLAQRSASAAKEIKGLISASVDEVEEGARFVQQAADTMDDVVTSFDLVASLVTEIADGSGEQSSGVEQVAQAIGQMDEVTQQNAALVEQAAAAAESLEDQARSLIAAVSVFKLGGEARRSSVPTVAPAPAAVKAPPARADAPRLPAKRAGTALPSPAAGEDDEWAEF